MKVVKTFVEEIELQFDIQTAAVFTEHELVILTCTGQVLLYNLESHQFEILFDTNPSREIRYKGIRYEDDGVDFMAASSIYVMDDVIVVVNDYKKQGFVLNGKEGYLIHFAREDYHADISKYPIALFKNEKGEPHLIFGVAWNHLQIVNLTTRQILTAAKSLMEEGAEEDYITYYKRFKEDNTSFWPSEYDYFFGELMMSPDSKKFLSAGWSWGSTDCYKTFDVGDFIQNHRIRDETVCYGEHECRGICFVDNQTVAALFHPYVEGEEDSSRDAPYEIRLFGVEGQGEVGKIILQTPVDLTGARLFYCEEEKLYIILSKKTGLIVASPNGGIALHNPSFTPQQYDKTFDMFICYEKKCLAIYRMED